jgi:uncharacterized OB-fold protein
VTLLVPQSPGIPLPRPSDLTRPFWDGCARGELLYQRCPRCGTAVFDPAPICPACRSRELEWQRSGGHGAVYSWTIARRPLSPAFTDVYAPIIVELDEGFWMISNLVGCDDGELAVGMRVEVAFHPIDDPQGGTVTLPYFRPETDRPSAS